MKKWRWAIVLMILFSTSCLMRIPARDWSYSRGGRYGRNVQRYDYRRNYGYYYDYRSPYGTWVRNGPYGYVWIPYRYRRY